MAKLKTIYEILSPYTKEEINFVIEKLEYKDKYLIYLRYGKNLENPSSNSWNKKYNYEFYNKLIFKMRRLLKSLQNGKKIAMGGRAITTIYQRFSDYKKSEVDYIISLLPSDDKKVLWLKYGSDLENPDTRNWKVEYEDKFVSICEKMNLRLKKRRNGEKVEFKIDGVLTIYQLLDGYSKEDIDNVLESLNSHDKHLIFLRYGCDLNNPDTRYWKGEYSSDFYKKLLPKIRRRLENIVRSRVGVKEEIVIKKQDNKELLKIVRETLEKLNNERYSILLKKYSIKEILSYVLIQKMDDNYNIVDITNFFGLDRKVVVHMATKVLHNMIKESEYDLKIRD